MWKGKPFSFPDREWREFIKRGGADRGLVSGKNSGLGGLPLPSLIPEGGRRIERKGRVSSRGRPRERQLSR